MNEKDEEKVKDAIEKGMDNAKNIVNNDKINQFLENLEKKLENIPKVGDELSEIPTLIELLRSYAKKEYTKTPVVSIISAVSALLYIVAPSDIVPDFIPILGSIDDVAVLIVCLKIMKPEIEKYKQWRDEK